MKSVTVFGDICVQDSQGVDKMMTIELKKPDRATLGLFTSSKRNVAQVGTSRFPKPKDNEAAKMKRSLRVILR